MHELQRSKARTFFSTSVSVHQILLLHLIASFADASKEAKLLEMIWSPDPQSETMPEWTQDLEEHHADLGRILLRIERIEHYLGRKPRSRDADADESTDWALKARWVRGMIQRGASNEDLACYLESPLRRDSTARRRGRPSGTMNNDGLALQALEIYNSNPEFWTWPKLADRVFADCKAHSKHKADDSCTVKLRQAATRLRAFIRELESVRLHTEIQSAIRDINTDPIVVT